MRTVTLEFLRHGAPHGHLLSPLARYMALCGSHEPIDVSAPFDHVELLSRLRALGYENGKTNNGELASTAKLLSDLLAQVPGLVAELADPRLARSQPTHLRIIFNATELSLLPFELANSAKAFPGAGQSLALQPDVPLCITREVRRPACANLQWPRRPKILFACSAAGGAVPFNEHKKKLEEAIEPWVFYRNSDAGGPESGLDEHLQVLPNVTVDALLEECSRGDYTHVHLLAHGKKIDDEERTRYALVFGPSEAEAHQPELVDGPWLAALLRPHVRGRIHHLARPTVVTLAACNSADARGGVGVGVGTSIAHALHEAGIPLVIASQFPLSKPGSIVLTEVLYQGLLAGVDPRLLLIDARRQLRIRAGNVHDWASLVAYASFPQDLDRQLPEVRVQRAALSVEAALSHADRATRAMSTLLQKSSSSPSQKADHEDVENLVESSKEKLRNALERLHRLSDAALSDTTLVHGRLASAHKRKGEMFLRPAAEGKEGRVEAVNALLRSRQQYQDAFIADPSQSWALVQSLVLSAALDGPAACQEDDLHLARILSMRDARTAVGQPRAWAYGNLLELRLLRTVISDPEPPGELPPWKNCVEELVRAVGRDAWEVHSTRRQLQRWAELFPEVRTHTAHTKGREPSWDRAKALASEMFDELPERLPSA